MPTINPLVPTQASAAGLNTGAAQPNDEVDEAQALAAAGALPPPTGVNRTGTSSFEAIKGTAASHVLSTPPPAEGGGRTSPVNLAEAIGRMRQLQIGVHPVVQALVRSSEDGNAPAVPSKTSATIGSGTAAATVSDATTPPATASSDSSSNAMGAVSQQIDTDVSGASDDVLQAGAKVESDASVTGKGACNKVTSPGQNQLQATLKHMGLSKAQAKTIASVLNDNNSDVSKAPGEATLLGAAIATYNKLGESDPAHKGTASQQIVTDLKIAANNYTASTSTGAAIYDKGDAAQAAIKAASDASGASGSGTADGAYTTAMNALQSYVVQGSNNAALTALTTPSAAATALQPYNWIGE